MARGAVTTTSLVSCLILVYIGFAASSKTNFIDENDIKKIADTVCSLDIATINKQIGRISTIDRLVEYGKGLTIKSELFNCFNPGSANPFEQLQLVVSKTNVCSEEKINLIERFHRNYISKSPKDKHLQTVTKLKAPQLLKQFFLHYAYQVSTICKDSLIMHYSKKTDVVLPVRDDAVELEKVDNLMKDFSKLGSSSSSKIYGDIVLLWNLIDRLPINQQENEYINESGPQRMAFKVQDTNTISRFQKECRRRLKPIYQPLALPVIRMIDLGYFMDGEPFSAQYSQSQDLKRLFGAAQICEFILQVRVIKDETLKQGDLVLITKEEANQIINDYEPEKDQFGDQIASDMADYKTPAIEDTLMTANPDQAGHLVKNLKANIRAREKGLSYIMKGLVKQMKSKAKTLFRRIFYMSKSSSDSSHAAFEKKDADPVINESLEGLTELELHENMAEMREGSVRRRRRRSLSKDFDTLKSIFKDSVFIGVMFAFLFLIEYFVKLIGSFVIFLGNILCTLFYYPSHQGLGLKYCWPPVFKTVF